MVLFAIPIYAQNTFKVYIKDSKTKEGIPGAAAGIINSTTGGAANENGLVVITNIPNGKHLLRYTAMGYAAMQDSLVFPLANTEPQQAIKMAASRKRNLMIVNIQKKTFLDP